MLRARTERLIIDTHRSLSQILDNAILALDNEIRPMRDGVDRDHLAVVRTQFDCIRKLLTPRRALTPTQRAALPGDLITVWTVGQILDALRGVDRQRPLRIEIPRPDELVESGFLDITHIDDAGPDQPVCIVTEPL